MMTKNTSRKVAILKQVALIPLIAAIGFLLSTRANAQDKPKQERERIMFMVGPRSEKDPKGGKPDAPQRVVDEYQSILSAYKIDTTTVKTFHFSYKPIEEEHQEFRRLTHLDTIKFKKADRERLENLFLQMSNTQQDKQWVQFMKIPAVKTKMAPTKAQMKLWQDPKEYGVWINGGRVKNAVLNTRPNTDFCYYELIKYDNEKAKIMKYKIEVGLLTDEVFERDQKESIARLNGSPDGKYDLLIRMFTDVKRPSIKITNK